MRKKTSRTGSILYWFLTHQKGGLFMSEMVICVLAFIIYLMDP